MTVYSDIFDQVVLWTKRSTDIALIDTAIRQAVRAAHRSGTFYRDLVKLPLTLTATTVQEIDLATVAPLYRQIATIGPTDSELKYTETQIYDLFDQDRYYKTDVFYVVGDSLHLRAASPATAITIVYYAYPVVSPLSSLSSWIAVQHSDLIALWASASILALVGEQEVKTRVEALAKLALADLIADGLSASGA